MHALRTAILEHTTATGVHHDWLIEDPRLPNPQATDARLWTARVTPPPTQWAALGRFDLTVIPPHRRAYLDDQGPVSGNRGRVRRLAQGTCIAEHWSAGRIALTMTIGPVSFDIQLSQQAGDHWLAIVG